MKADSLIIDRPERQSWFQRVLFLFITAIAWILWLSLWLPLLTVVASLLGFEGALNRFGFNHPFGVTTSLRMVLELALVAGVVVGGWSFYNRMRFAGRQRRQNNNAISLAAMAPALSASLETAEYLREGRRSVVHFGDDGKPYVTPVTESVD